MTPVKLSVQLLVIQKVNDEVANQSAQIRKLSCPFIVHISKTFLWHDSTRMTMILKIVFLNINVLLTKEVCGQKKFRFVLYLYCILYVCKQQNP